MSLNYPYKCLNVLGNKLRIKIIKSLLKKPKTVFELCDEINVEQSAISHSLQQLRKCNFVDFRKKGKEREYYIKSEIFLENSNKNILELMEEHVKKYCEAEK